MEEAQDLYGAVLVLEGQDWGPDETNRLSNLRAVIEALARLPTRVVSAVGPAHRHGAVQVLSNTAGRSLLGWQPYGDFPIAFYTNSDRRRAGETVPANQVVLIPGFADTSVGHELLHAYQFRDVRPDRYGLAALGDEMQSFMRAVGWRLVGSEAEVAETAGSDASWSEFNALFAYEGRPLVYETAPGSETVLSPPNPLEGFAVAGSFCYTRPQWLPLPRWPEYWAWFQANLGSAV